MIIKIGVFIFFMTLVLSLDQLSFSTTLLGFPKIIWTYWEQGLDQMPMFTKLCINNKKSIGQINGWRLIFVSRQTLHNYIDLNELQTYVQMSFAKHIQFKVDIIRYLLIERYGGMWMDANTYFLRDLQWVQDLNISLIQNRLSEAPDIILGAYRQFGETNNTRYEFDSRHNQTVNVFPIYQNWFILAKPNNSFIKDSLSALITTFQKGKQVMDTQLAQSGIIISTNLSIPYLIASDYIFQIALQQKQKQLQKERSMVKYAVEYYKIWHFQAAESIFKIFLEYLPYMVPMWADQSMYSLLEKEGQNQMIFRKYLGWNFIYFSFYLENYATFNCWGANSLIQPNSEIDEFLLSHSRKSIISNEIEQINLNSNQTCPQYIKQQKKTTFYQAFLQYSMLIVVSIYFVSYMALSFCNSINPKDIFDWQ